MTTRNQENIDTNDKINIKSVMQNKWKEIIILEEEAQRNQRRNIKKNMLKNSYIESQNGENQRNKFENKNNTNDNKKTKQNAKQDKKNEDSDDSGEESASGLPPVTKRTMNPGYFDLNEQIKERRKGIARVKETMEALEDKKKKQEEDNQMETARIENALGKIKNKSISSIVKYSGISYR